MLTAGRKLSDARVPKLPVGSGKGHEEWLTRGHRGPDAHVFETIASVLKFLARELTRFDKTALGSRRRWDDAGLIVHTGTATVIRIVVRQIGDFFAIPREPTSTPSGVSVSRGMNSKASCDRRSEEGLNHRPKLCPAHGANY